MPDKNDLTLKQAVSLYCPDNYEALKRACQKGQVQGARKIGIQWFVSPTAVQHWQANRPRIGRPARQTQATK